MPNLYVVDGEAPPSEVGTKNWAAGVRQKAKNLAGKLETGYMDLARILYTVYDTPVDGDSQNPPIYTLWGYKTFADYAETELGLHYKKAQRLRNIWYRLEVELADLDPEIKQRVVNIGYSKVRELVRVLTLSNAQSWVEKAELMSYPTLVAAIAKYNDDLEDNQIIEHVAKTEGDVVAKANDITGELPEDPVPVEMVKFKEPEVSEEKVFSFQFHLFPDQAETVKLALHRAAQLSESEKKGHNLSLICLDFLATNNFTTANGQQQLKFVARLEKALGFRFIVVDPQTSEIVYGFKTLDNLAKVVESKESPSEEESE